MKKLDRNSGLFALSTLIVVLMIAFTLSPHSLPPLTHPLSHQGAVSVASPFIYNFDSPRTLHETGSMNRSMSPYWWLNSGGQFIVEEDFGKTIQGEAPFLNRWRILYSLTNPIDTDEGLHPQNLFRLVSRHTWGNATTQLSFRITEFNLSNSPNRNASNGVLLFGRYEDGDNLYYAGIRDDGQAVIKKKINGAYHTLAIQPIFGTPDKYDRDARPTLLPDGAWMAIRMSIENAWDGSVLIRLSIDRENNGSFISILSVRDTGIGGEPFRGEGHIGIRTDFKDVEFQAFRVDSI